ncbi:hypothetical protein ES708_10408 [subsurface metagenome]
MKAQQYELDLIKREGYYYQVKPRRGWYYRGKWVGYSVKDAFNHRAELYGYSNESLESSRV